MVGAGEAQAGLETVTAHGVPDRALGGDMDRVGRELAQACRDHPPGGDGEPDGGVARARDGTEEPRVQDHDLEAERLELDHRAVQGGDDPVDLGVPGIGRDGDACRGQTLGSGRGLHLLERVTGVGPVDQLERPVMKLDERRAALHPIPAVAIQNPVQVGDLGAMDVAQMSPSTRWRAAS
jgi:hypothetical protein